MLTASSRHTLQRLCAVLGAKTGCTASHMRCLLRIGLQQCIGRHENTIAHMMCFISIHSTYKVEHVMFRCRRSAKHFECKCRSRTFPRLVLGQGV